MRPHQLLWRRLKGYVRRSDWPVVPLAAAIMSVGLLVQWSVAGPENFPTHHLLRLGMAGGACLVAAAIPARWWRANAPLFYAACMVLLVYVLVSGRATNNARRWVDLFGGFKLQPSEFMKLALILMLARWFAERPRPRRIRQLLVPGAMAALPFLLVLAEPDLGTALTFAPLFLAMAYLAGTRRRVLVPVVLVPLLLAPVGFMLLRDYQAERLSTWWKQGELTDEQKADTGYHLWHSKMAIGSGGALGFGWAEGPENRMHRLPERTTDFVFSVLSEELGFLGASAFLLLYASLAATAFWASTRHRDPFARFVIAGVGVHFAVHLTINVGVATGLWPTTGLPLPMVSWGGSSMAVSGMALGVVLSTGAYREPILWRTSED